MTRRTAQPPPLGPWDPLTLDPGPRNLLALYHAPPAPRRPPAAPGVGSPSALSPPPRSPLPAVTGGPRPVPAEPPAPSRQPSAVGGVGEDSRRRLGTGTADRGGSVADERPTSSDRREGRSRGGRSGDRPHARRPRPRHPERGLGPLLPGVRLPLAAPPAPNASRRPRAPPAAPGSSPSIPSVSDPTPPGGVTGDGRSPAAGDRSAAPIETAGRTRRHRIRPHPDDPSRVSGGVRAGDRLLRDPTATPRGSLPARRRGRLAALGPDPLRSPRRLVFPRRLRSARRRRGRPARSEKAPRSVASARSGGSWSPSPSVGSRLPRRTPSLITLRPAAGSGATRLRRLPYHHNP